MKTFVLCALFLFVAVTVAQLSAGEAWQGVWSEGKRNLGGNTYICVDPWTQTAHGSYGNVGLFSGYLWGNTLTGFWYEAGYDRPFGPFRLTISGSSFTGTWSYFQSPNVTYSWSGSRQSTTRPEDTQCLIPYTTGQTVEGNYNGGQYICRDPTYTYGNSDQTYASATFDNFGTVIGFSPDNGRTISLSDFYVTNATAEANGEYRPENNVVNLGTAVNPYTPPRGSPILTQKLVIGRQISDTVFCGFFWDGLYVRQYSDKAICFEKLNQVAPELSHCEAQQIGQRPGITNWILSQIQSVLDHIQMPHITIAADGPIIRFPTIPGVFDDDDVPRDDDDLLPTITYFTTITTVLPSFYSDASTLVFSVGALVASVVLLI